MPVSDGHNFDAAKVKELTTAFNKYDTDGSGKINSSELIAAMGATGNTITDAEASAFIADFDLDGDGEISLEEFLVMVAKQEKSSEEEVQKATFKELDDEMMGFLTAANLKRALDACGGGGKFTEAEIEAAIVEADKDGDGKVNMGDFTAMWAVVKP